MKTYQEYEKIIKDKEIEEYKELHKGHDHSKTMCVVINQARMSIDVSIEILVMAMKDFLNDFKK